jgi:paraquat-inducible protein A
MTPPVTAARQGLVSCHCCALVSRNPGGKGHPPTACPRCGATLHTRKTNSLARTWSLLIAAFIFYIPANVLPIMTSTTLINTQSDTILSGVMYLLATGNWPIAAVIFFASVIVPMMKLIILTVLLVSVHKRSVWRPLERTRLYRIIEVVGRWSMIDVYVVTILVALVHLGAIAQVEAGPGAVFFAAVVIISMLAALTFDPRLIWDQQELPHE